MALLGTILCVLVGGKDLLFSLLSTKRDEAWFVVSSSVTDIAHTNKLPVKVFMIKSQVCFCELHVYVVGCVSSPSPGGSWRVKWLNVARETALLDMDTYILYTNKHSLTCWRKDIWWLIWIKVCDNTRPMLVILALFQFQGWGDFILLQRKQSSRSGFVGKMNLFKLYWYWNN